MCILGFGVLYECCVLSGFKDFRWCRGGNVVVGFGVCGAFIVLVFFFYGIFAGWGLFCLFI